MANIRSWTQIWPSFVMLCILNLVLDYKIIALADGNGSSGFAPVNTCKNTNYQSFLPSPYQNISNLICTPVWHTYELRVNSLSCDHVGLPICYSFFLISMKLFWTCSLWSSSSWLIFYTKSSYRNLLFCWLMMMPWLSLCNLNSLVVIIYCSIYRVIIPQLSHYLLPTL